MKVQTSTNLIQTQSARPKSDAPAPDAPPAPPSDSVGPPVTPKEEKEWTILFYMNGNNAQTGQMVSAMRQLEYVGSNANANLVAQVARPKALLDKFSHDWSGTRRYEIIANGEKLTPGVLIADSLTGFLPGKTKGIKSPVLEDMGAEVDMGKSQTLEQFMEWGMAKFPSKHTMVVVMGPSEGLSGMNEDVLSGSKMTAADLGQAFKNVKEKTGKKVDIVTLDGSATNTMEVAYELKDSAKYMIGSQGIQGASGMPPSFVLNEIQNVNKDGAQTPLTLVNYWMLMNSMAGGTLSTIDLEKMDGVKAAWNQLSQSLLDANVSSDKLRSLLDGTQDFQGRSKNEAYQNSRDAEHFAKLVRADKEITDPKVKEAAQAAIDSIEAAIKDGGSVATGKYVAEANGMSVFGPTQYGYFRPDGSINTANPLRDAKYSETAFAKDTVWDDVLSKAGKDSIVNNTLKKIGFSETSIDKMNAGYQKNVGKVDGVLGLAGIAAWSNALNAWRGGNPMIGNWTAYAGAASSVVNMGKGVGDMIYAGRELKDTDEVVNRGFDVAKAACMGVANLGMVVPQLKPYAATAGMLMFMSPWIRDIYGVVENYKNIRHGVELGLSSQTSSESVKVGDAVRKYYGDKSLNDHAELSVWQKLAG